MGWEDLRDNQKPDGTTETLGIRTDSTGEQSRLRFTMLLTNFPNSFPSTEHNNLYAIWRHPSGYTNARK
jgi:hypothetical protein